MNRTEQRGVSDHTIKSQIDVLRIEDEEVVMYNIDIMACARERRMNRGMKRVAFRNLVMALGKMREIH